MRVTVIRHDNNFSDLSACTFWLLPGQALSNYTYRAFATQAWSNATLTVYPATTGPDQWIRLDNVPLRLTPSATITGTECLEPGSSPDVQSAVSASGGSGFGVSVPVPVDVELGTARGRGFQPTDEVAPGGSAGWVGVGAGTEPRVLQLVEPLALSDATSAHLRFQSWLTSATSRATVEVSTDGLTWEGVHRVAATDTWTEVDVDLRGYLGSTGFVRFVLTDSDAQAGEVSN